MEVFQTDLYYIFVRKEKSLWWNRTNSEFAVKSGWDLSSVDDIECLGITQGILGAISLPGVYSPRLVIIKEASPVGVLYAPHLVYKIRSVCVLSADPPENGLTQCTRHSSTQRCATTTASNSSPSAKSRLFEGGHLVGKTWGAVKSAGSTIKSTTQQAAALASNQMKSTVGIRDPSRVERRVTDELHKIFDDTDSFYYCPDADITNNLQRIGHQERDQRFFWNNYMLKDILKLEDQSWTLPIIQGFVQVEQCVIGNECFTLALVSRRSRYRAGTRYKRRGVDESGHCANYVETEQILSFRAHQMAFSQVRGSVPVFWSQPGYKYRPPPRIDRGEDETQVAFERHFNEELDMYKSIAIVNLVEQSGKEKIIGDAYALHVVKFNSDQLLYVTFDFHDYCRGMRFENVAALIEALAPEAGAMGFHWRDAKGAICDQRSVFRVNCMDCLDRTNVVQTALGKAVLESQLVKLGLAPPYSPIPEQLKAPFMLLWANNGDIISRQYAGTNALKGDYTRTGERKFTGMMKDGMNSANRYYLARFKDTYRQATIDLMLGNPVSAESLNALGGQVAGDETETLEGAEHARQLVEDCRRMLLGAAQYPIGSWGLIDADPNSGDPNETEVDMILLLTDDCYIVAEYDSHLDKIVRFEKVLLANVTLIELGMAQYSQKLFQSPGVAHLSLRLNYARDGVDAYAHTFRSANIRFFNNVAVAIKTPEELQESLSAIAEFFLVALDNQGRKDVQFVSSAVLQRRKSRPSMLDVPRGIPRNLSESQLLQLGTKALTNVAGQFSKLGQSLNPAKKKQAAGTNRTAVKSKSVIFNSPSIEQSMFAAAEEDGTKKANEFDTSSDSGEENECSIYEPDCSDLVQENPIYMENTFLPSVGIVMSTSSGEVVDSIKEVAAGPKLSSDVSALSISSVTDHVIMPPGMLESGASMRSLSPAPEIRVDAVGGAVGLAASGSQSFSHSSGEVYGRAVSPSERDLTLNLSGSQSDNALKQLKTLTSPLSKLAKGMQSFGMNLDPRKIGSKSGGGVQTRPAEMPIAQPAHFESEKLQQKWDASKCKTKLIAL